MDATPVWFMRQAGRYLPEYRALRARHGFLEMATTPEIAAEVTLQPVRRLGVDAAILFADILLPLPAMGAPIHFADGEGPVIDRPVRDAAAVEAMRVADPGDLGYVGETLRLVAADLPAGVALIGFAGAPFTLASYLIEGGRSESFARTKLLMWNEPGLFRLLMEKLAATTAAYLAMQIAAGAQAVQLFDSWAGCLAPGDYEAHVLPHSRAVFEAVRAAGVPAIHFAADGAGLLPLLAKAGGDVLGVDWRISLSRARELAGGVPLQGNLDPAVLIADPGAALAATDRVLAEARGGPHLFNTGHGLTPETPVDTVRRVVDRVHEASAGRKPGWTGGRGRA